MYLNMVSFSDNFMFAETYLRTDNKYTIKHKLGLRVATKITLFLRLHKVPYILRN